MYYSSVNELAVRIERDRLEKERMRAEKHNHFISLKSKRKFANALKHLAVVMRKEKTRSPALGHATSR